mgnify:CR=1 FL=1
MEAVKNSSALKCDADTTVVIYGKNPLREALMDLFAKENFFRHVTEFIRRTPFLHLPKEPCILYL